MGRELQAKDIMESEVVTLDPGTSLAEAWEMLRQNKISGAPVVSREEGLIGVISQTDLLREVSQDRTEDVPPSDYYLGAPFWDNDELPSLPDTFTDMCVQEAMSPTVVSAAPDDDISTIAVKMRSNRVHRVVVVDKDAVVGIVSALGLLQVLEDH